ncbi:HAD family hydrolase [Falsirhodobacter sp. 1013]|uniref:HAD family hydrolase n=1 Tax=Falsirhodobacter sp. 1013 TaxID=3417566 RepID=UPI003EB6F9C1
MFGVGIVTAFLLLIDRRTSSRPNLTPKDMSVASSLSPDRSGHQQTSRPRAVAFDAFGTLLNIEDNRNPWRRIAQAGAGYSIDPRVVPIDLQGFAAACGVPWNENWASDLDAELRSIRPYGDALETLEELRLEGIKLAIISNLAKPYVSVVQSLLKRHVDVEVYSCDVGSAKPQPEIFARLCAQLDLPPSDILVVGDNQVSDVDGAREGARDQASIGDLFELRCLLLGLCNKEAANDKH